MTLLASWLMLPFLLSQEVYGPADFIRVAGNSLQARYDSAAAEGRRAMTDTFWVAYQIPVRRGVRVDWRDGSVNVSSPRNSDGIEFVSSTADAERVGVFLMMRKSDGTIEKTRILNLNENFKVHDRKVYWIGEPSAEESVTFLTTLVPKVSRASPLLMTISLHPDPYAADNLLRVARRSTSTDTKK